MHACSSPRPELPLLRQLPGQRRTGRRSLFALRKLELALNIVRGKSGNEGH